MRIDASVPLDAWKCTIWTRIYAFSSRKSTIWTTNDPFAAQQSIFWTPDCFYFEEMKA